MTPFGFFYGYFEHRTVVAYHFAGSLAEKPNASSATAASGRIKTDNNDHDHDHDQTISFEDFILPLYSCWVCSTVWCIRNVCFIINSLSSTIWHCRYEKCKTREKDEFLFFIFSRVFCLFVCLFCAFLSVPILVFRLSLLFSFVSHLSSKCVLFELMPYV